MVSVGKLRAAKVRVEHIIETRRALERRLETEPMPPHERVAIMARLVMLEMQGRDALREVGVTV